MAARILAAMVIAAMLATGCRDEPAAVCEMPPPQEAALAHAGLQTNGDIVLPGGRRLAPTGTQVVLGGYPAELLLHPTIDVAIVDNVGYALRALQVVRRSDGVIVQSLERSETWHGMVLSPDGTKLYVATGAGGTIDRYSVDPTDGHLTPDVQIPRTGSPAGLAISSDGAELFSVSFADGTLVGIDTTSLATTRSLTLAGYGPFALTKIPGRNELYVGFLRSRDLVVVDLGSFTAVATLSFGGEGPFAIEPTPDGTRVFVSVPDDERVVAISTSTRAIVADRRLGEGESLDRPDGSPLPATSPTGLGYDAVSNRVLVARAGDNALAVLDGTSLAPLGLIPTGWYPTDVAVSGTKVVVANGKGIGTGPTRLINGDPEGKETMRGSISLFDLATLDLAQTTSDALANLARPNDAYVADCQDRSFPVPTEAGGPTPIEHIVLIVKENKTYDSVFGDLEGTDADPSLLMWGPEITPNLHAMARQFANHDNFYDDGESSVQGHFWLTYEFVNHYMEHVSYFEDYRGRPGYGQDPAKEEATPGFGSFFEHLIRHDIDFRIFGEVVGASGRAVNGIGLDLPVSGFVEFGFPGVFYNNSIRDREKAQYVADYYRENGLPQFSYVLLPNDHTNGLGAGEWTPRSMVAENDYATGLLVDAISRLPEWGTTAIFIVQDDTQSGADHVDLHRSILLVASPWARHGETSHVHSSYPSLFRTFEHILGIPPLNRYDANATPLYDTFSGTRNLEPYTVIERILPEEYNPKSFHHLSRAFQVAARWSNAIDFDEPDASADLGDIVALAQLGEPPPGSRLARVVAGEIRDTGPAVEDDGDADAHEAELRAAMRILRSRPDLRARISPNDRARLGL